MQLDSGRSSLITQASELYTATEAFQEGIAHNEMLYELGIAIVRPIVLVVYSGGIYDSAD